jgi:hypothetical protein
MSTTPLRRIAIVTSEMGERLDADMPPLTAALRERGLHPEPVRWDDPAADWQSYDAAVIRSTWDYADNPPAFLAWADRAGAATRLDNAAELVRWNHDKRYLRDLAGAGVPVVPTVYAAPGQAVELPEDREFVVKPAVSVAARNTARYEPGHREAALAHIADLHAAGATVLVQPYLKRIGEGESALVFLGGTFSHAIRKGPVITDIATVDNNRVPHPDVAAHDPEPAELALARGTLAALRAIPAVAGAAPPLYARIDIVRDDAGGPVLMELELIEPSLFLPYGHGATARFADAIRARTPQGR